MVGTLFFVVVVVGDSDVILNRPEDPETKD